VTFSNAATSTVATCSHGKGSASFFVALGLTANQPVYLVVSNKTATSFQVTAYATAGGAAKLTATVTFDWILV